MNNTNIELTDREKANVMLTRMDEAYGDALREAHSRTEWLRTKVKFLRQSKEREAMILALLAVAPPGVFDLERKTVTHDSDFGETYETKMSKVTVNLGDRREEVEIKEHYTGSGYGYHRNSNGMRYFLPWWRINERPNTAYKAPRTVVKKVREFRDQLDARAKRGEVQARNKLEAAELAVAALMQAIVTYGHKDAKIIHVDHEPSTSWRKYATGAYVQVTREGVGVLKLSYKASEVDGVLFEVYGLSLVGEAKDRAVSEFGGES